MTESCWELSQWDCRKDSVEGFALLKEISAICSFCGLSKMGMNCKQRSGEGERGRERNRAGNLDPSKEFAMGTSISRTSHPPPLQSHFNRAASPVSPPWHAIYR